MFLIISTHAVTVPVYCYGSHPLSCEWQVFVSDEEYESHCIQRVNEDFFNAWLVFLNAFTIVLDIVIIIIPCRPVWKLNMPKRQKIVVLGIFVSGIMYEPLPPHNQSAPKILTKRNLESRLQARCGLGISSNG